jgi:hypothetical protein
MEISSSRIQPSPAEHSQSQIIDSLVAKCKSIVSGLAGRPISQHPRSEPGGHVEKRFFQGMAATGIKDIPDLEICDAWCDALRKILKKYSDNAKKCRPVIVPHYNRMVVHYILRAGEGEVIGSDAAERILDIFFECMGYGLTGEYLSMSPFHSGPDRAHIHVVVCRINLKTLRLAREGDDGWMGKASRRAEARMEAELGMESSPLSRLEYRNGEYITKKLPFDDEKMYLDKASRLYEIDTGLPSRKRLIIRKCREIAHEVESGKITSWEMLMAALSRHGYTYFIGTHGAGNIRADTDKIFATHCRLSRRDMEKKFGPVVL